MSHKMTALAMRQKGLKPAAKIVLYWLADHHNSETGLCCPSLKTLSEESEMSKSSLIGWLRKLEVIGKISRDNRTRPNGSQTSNKYKLHMSDNPKKRVSKNKTGMSSNETGGLSNSDTPITLEDTNLGIELVNAQKRSGFFPEIQNKSEQEATFVQFYSAYPVKKGKPAALKAWAKAIKRDSASTIIEGAKRYADWLKNPKAGNFRPHPKHPQGWLNDDRWKDDEIWHDLDTGPVWSTISKSRRNLLEKGICPPSMLGDDGKPNKTAIELYRTLAISRTQELNYGK